MFYAISQGSSCDVESMSETEHCPALHSLPFTGALRVKKQPTSSEAKSIHLSNDELAERLLFTCIKSRNWVIFKPSKPELPGGCTSPVLGAGQLPGSLW